MPEPDQPQPIDFRQYIGIVFFRWQIIVVCFLYCLLGGVLYIHLVPKLYQAECRLAIHVDPALVISKQSPDWISVPLHRYMLSNDMLVNRVVDKLLPDWGERFSSERQMEADIDVEWDRRLPRILTVLVKSRDSQYSQVFLETLVTEHIAEWENLQRQARESAGAMLEVELERLAQNIRESEDDLLEYQRLHDIARTEARSTMEGRYLEALMERGNQLTTELMLLEAQFPALKEEGPAVISDINRLTRETGAVAAIPEREVDDEGEEIYLREEPAVTPTAIVDDEAAGMVSEWRALQTRVIRLEQVERQLAADLRPGHPQLIETRKEIRKVRDQLEVAAETELARLRDRHKALTIQLNALEAAEYQWQAKNLLASQRKAEYKRIANVVERFEDNYSTLYSRLHNMRVSEELKAVQLNVSEPPAALAGHVWPDAGKVIMLALALGVGSGVGLALVTQLTDNKVQSIKDVEVELGMPFLGGVPYWVHGGLETTIRPIVTEEHSAGAVEAYRALRTSILSAMDKMNEKVLLITSADSREGKTLTALNLSIMIAQMDKRVLLVDMDLRRGRLHRSLGTDRSPGVTDALQKRESLRSYVVGTRIEGLDLVPTGRTVDDAAELLQSTGVVNLFAELQDDYDYIIVDTSPVLRVTDTVILATQGVGVALYVARVNHTPKPLIKYSLNMLSEARILGLVMNSIEMHKISSLYYAYQYPNYAYYSNAYAYGYNYYYYGDFDGKRGGRRRNRGGIGRILRKARETFLPME